MKKYKSFRFWVISLLAVSSVAFSTSLLLSSCITTDEGTKIRVPSMSNTLQEVEVGKDTSLFVEANCAGKVLNYQWYKAIDANATQWEKIDGANNNTYNIPQSDLTNGINSTLKYKVEVTSVDDSVPKYTSPVFSIKVNNSSSINTITFTSNLSPTATMTIGEEKTFNVIAITTNTSEIVYYDWYIDKGSNAFSKVETNTSGSYIIKSTDTSGFIETQNWKLYVEAYSSNNVGSKVKSQVCSINISPKNSNGSQTYTISFVKDLSTSDSMIAGDTKTLTVEAQVNNMYSANITYEWQVDKVNSGTYTTIKSSMDSSYTIDDTTNITNKTNWKIQVKAYVANNPSIFVNSNTCTLTINPKNSTPSPTPPNPSPNPEEPDNPSIIPPPSQNPNQGIGGRLSYDNSGINTVKYNQEKYIGNNSISIAIIAKPNINNIREKINSYIESNISGYDVKKQTLNRVLGNFPNKYDDEYNQFGTGWILDYSNGTNNLADYYIASNMHVLSSYFTIKYPSIAYIDQYNTKNIEATLRVPFNKETVSSLAVYISQPQYNTINYKNNINSYAYKWNTQWLQTDINANNLEDRLIPIGAYNATNITNLKDALMIGNGFDMEIQLAERDSHGNTLDWKDAYYFKQNSSGGWLTQIATNGFVQRTRTAEDFSVLKISMNSNKEFDSKINSVENQYKLMFQKMKQMFSTNINIASVDEQSSYITKLRKLLTLTTNVNTYNTNKIDVDKLFMFYDKSLIVGDSKTQLSIGGYPVKYEVVNNERKYYAIYNMNTMTTLGNNIITYPYSPSDSRNKLGINQYTYKGGLYKLLFKSDNDFLMKNGMLQQGSSGGLVISQNYKIACINWGQYNYMQQEDDFKFLVECGIITSLYQKNNKNSLIWEWISYMGSKNISTELQTLFNNLEKVGYFK